MSCTEIGASSALNRTCKKITHFSILFYSEQLHLTDGIALALVTLSIFAAESQKSAPAPLVVVRHPLSTSAH
ncbi:hypothetical protein HX882_11185 [Pseudomonas gingeri]|uniref:Uncharacterized protein n=1 Tax=Pseudomonas gingeri TaxID=117681 RepID=A0A7Y7XBE2_9PSED|nr:hypothetical protein [Pseudomonas gingeri]NWB96456.1 hypothetical protein [Pseudomonas gingeri]